MDGYYGASPGITNLVLALYALAAWWLLDRTKASFVLGVATAFAGPVAELLLVNWLHLYQYNNADFYGICSWIPWVYFLGGPAVGSLARSVSCELQNRNAI